MLGNRVHGGEVGPGAVDPGRWAARGDPEPRVSSKRRSWGLVLERPPHPVPEVPEAGLQLLDVLDQPEGVLPAQTRDLAGGEHGQ